MGPCKLAGNRLSAGSPNCNSLGANPVVSWTTEFISSSNLFSSPAHRVWQSPQNARHNRPNSRITRSTGSLPADVELMYRPLIDYSGTHFLQRVFPTYRAKLSTLVAQHPFTYAQFGKILSHFIHRNSRGCFLNRKKSNIFREHVHNDKNIVHTASACGSGPKKS